MMEDLDRQIASVMDCNPLLEDEVVRLCEKVRAPSGDARGRMHTAPCVQHVTRPVPVRASALCW